MRKVFIIPGFREKVTNDQYVKVGRIFKAAHIQPVFVPIDWNYKTMSQYVKQFEDRYHTSAGETNYILGFSFGAIVALIASARLRPQQLILCSLSPYFNEDLPLLKKSWRKAVGRKRLKDFSQYSSRSLGKEISSRTTIFVGEKEAQEYPLMLTRAKEVKSGIPKSKLIMIPKGRHNIGQPEYLAVIKDLVRLQRE